MRYSTSEAPMRIIQMRTRYNKWITAETKNEMFLRDTGSRDCQTVRLWTRIGLSTEEGGTCVQKSREVTKNNF